MYSGQRQACLRPRFILRMSGTTGVEDKKKKGFGSCCLMGAASGVTVVVRSDE